MPCSKVLEGCTVEVQAYRGVIYIHHPSGAYTYIRISGLTPEQCEMEMIDVRAKQPRSHNETVYGWGEDRPVPENLKEKRNADR